MSEKTLQQLARETYDRLWTKQPTETEMDVIKSAIALLHAALNSEHHCATCQCNKLNDEANRRVPANPMSRSWHRD